MITFYLNDTENRILPATRNKTLLHYLRERTWHYFGEGWLFRTGCLRRLHVEIDGKAGFLYPEDEIPGRVRGHHHGGNSRKGAGCHCQGICGKGSRSMRILHPGTDHADQGSVYRKSQSHREQIKKAINLNLCRCTGYVKIVDAIEAALTDTYETGNGNPAVAEPERPVSDNPCANMRPLKRPSGKGSLSMICISMECFTAPCGSAIIRGQRLFPSILQKH